MSKNIPWEKLSSRASRHILNAENKSIKNRTLRRLYKLPKLLLWYIKHPGYFFRNGLYYSNIELAVTTNCTLRCKDCCHFTTKFSHAPFTSSDILIDDLKKLLNSIERIDEFRVLGGEPLLYPDLYKIIQFLLSSEKIGGVEIVTNGTLSLPQEIENMFPNERLNIYVSNYGALSRKISEYESNSRINANISGEDDSWYDHGNLIFKSKTSEELKTQFAKCYKERCVMFEGKLYSCATSAFGYSLGAFQLSPTEYVDLRNAKDKRDIQKQLKALKHHKYITACSYCNWGTDQFISIPVAEQI